MDTDEIAVVGMAGRFPGADNIWEFWENIKTGTESISFFEDDILAAHDVPLADINNPNYVKAKGILKDAELFAASFFGYSAYESKIMDPQHRILLETTFLALENAGIVTDTYSGRVGVFVSAGFNTYMPHCLATKPELNDSKNYYQFAVANGNDFLATRLAYKLNLTGPAQTVQTACSSSLVAIHCACQSLLNYESGAVLAGGVCVTSPLVSGYLYKKGGIASPDGHCRPFDANAAGTVPGNGVGMVVLKRLADAIADNDHIYAVIKASAVNNDGNQKISYTAPSVQGQEQAIKAAHALAGITPRSIGYFETHGTGTALGDPIELTALQRCVAENGYDSPPTAIGSVKANIGHLDTAAGVAGFIKAVLMLYHKQLPPQINFSAMNPHIRTEDSSFYVNTQLQRWDRLSEPRRAGVSAFGIGGTNAHIVIEEYVSREDAALKEDGIYYLLPISGENTQVMKRASASLLEYLEKNRSVPLADVAYTLQTRRKPHEERMCVLAQRSDMHVHYTEVMPGDNRLTSLQHEQVGTYLAGGEMIGSRADCHVVPLPSYPLQRERYWISEEKGHDHVLHMHNTASDLSFPAVEHATVEHHLCAILKELLDTDTIVPSRHFEEMGVDSLMFIDLGLLIEERLGRAVASNDFVRYPTIKELAHYLSQSSQQASTEKSILPHLAVEITKGQPGGPIIFCIHPAGGNVTVFQEIASHIDYRFRLIGIRGKGWDGKDVPDRTIDAMAQTCMDVMQNIQEVGPYFLCGSSIGGTIATEIARKLSTMDEEVRLLALLDSPASFQHDKSVNIPDTVEEIKHYIQMLCPKMAKEVKMLEVRNPLAMQHFYTLWKIHAHSLIQYVPKPLTTEAIYFRASETSQFLPRDLLSPWIGLCTKGIEVHNTTGNHLSMHQNKGAKYIAEILNRSLFSYASPLPHHTSATIYSRVT